MLVTIDGIEMNLSTPRHNFPTSPPNYWACRYPERPPERPHVRYCLTCMPCMIAVEASLRTQDPAKTVRLWRNTNGDYINVTVGRWLTRIGPELRRVLTELAAADG